MGDLVSTIPEKFRPTKNEATTWFFFLCKPQSVQKVRIDVTNLTTWCLISVSNEDAPFLPHYPDFTLMNLRHHLYEIDRDSSCLFNTWSHPPLRWRPYLELCAHKLLSFLSSNINPIQRAYVTFKKNSPRWPSITFACYIRFQNLKWQSTWFATAN